eukprot:3181468-Amphidinium_carterae.1
MERLRDLLGETDAELAIVEDVTVRTVPKVHNATSTMAIGHSSFFQCALSLISTENNKKEC